MIRLKSALTGSFVGVLTIFTSISCSPNADTQETNQETNTVNPHSPAAERAAIESLPVEKYVLDNGLNVLLHVDRSDPVVAIDLAVHVGSGREKPGRTGFAHLFEHLLFLDSENLGYGGLDAMNTRIGGDGTNGFTTHDMTQYFQTVPKDALEKIVWAEADKLGWFIETVTQNVIDNEKQVVKNEKRQRVDNQPYGHNFYIVNKALYPADHPYNWTVIGSLADLDAATLEDVHEFYKRWYVPNNVTVTITGDFELDEAKAYVEKYFGEIPKGEPVSRPKARRSNLSANKSLMYEDNFATVPQLTLVWPTVPEFHPDSYALNVLAEYLTDGKDAPLNQVLIDEKKLTSDVASYQYGKELAGEFYIFVKPNAGGDIDWLIPALDEAFVKFETEGISQDDLNRVKAGQEVEFYNDVQSALGMAIRLGEYNLFTDDPRYFVKDIEHMQAVTTEDVKRVFLKYIKNQPRLATSIVPKGQADLALEDAEQAKIIEEKIVPGEGAPVDFDPRTRVIENPTPSSFDRTVEPPFGKEYKLPSPEVWQSKLDNGIEVAGIFSDDVPLVYFSLALDAGSKYGDPAKPAVAALTGDMLLKGTKSKSTSELENAIKTLGSNIHVEVGPYRTLIAGETLARNFGETIKLVDEILTSPRWDAEEFDTLKRKELNALEVEEGSPTAIANRELLKLRYPADHMFHYMPYGTKEKMESVTLDDLKDFYKNHYGPERAKLGIVGAVKESEVKSVFKTMDNHWTLTNTPPKTMPQEAPVTESKIYFYDIPGAKQSVLRLHRPAISAKHPDYPLVEAINFPLGGIYTSLLNTELRVKRGYTYGIRSFFSGATDRGRFGINTNVRSNATFESLGLIKQLVSQYGSNFTESDLAMMKDSLIRGQALDNETLADKLAMLIEMAVYDYPSDFQAQNAERIKNMSLEKFKSLAETHLRTDAMDYLVVGDAETQLERLNELGFGEPILLNPQ